MKISALRVVNYKGFFDSGFVELSGTWNVIVGQNNAGKTAFIEGFRLGRNSEHKPHKNISFSRDFPYPTISRFTAKMQFSREWLKNCWLKLGSTFELPIGSGATRGTPSEVDPKTFWEGPDLQVELEFHPGNEIQSAWPSHRLFPADGEERFAQFRPTNDRKVGVFSTHGGVTDSLPNVVLKSYAAHIYMFEAKRFAVGECGHEDTTILRPDAGNLPAVLLKLAANPELFREFNRNVSVIFPNIKWISITTKGGLFEIRVWSVDPNTQRDDLSVPLNESGAGVGQVLAILYVAMTNEPGVIAIDEPNSFLHPGAAKKLIQILKRYPLHQYVISTHSPEVISEAQPATLHLVRFDGRQSVVETFGEAEIETKRMMLEEIGASLADIFSAEQVIWVEGPTERECFDLIVAEELNGPIVGLSFVALRNTGDLDGKQADAALDIYDALTQGGSILPVSVWFSFDSEGKSERQIEDLRRRCGGRAKFLPRRMTENYLLSPAAIAAVLTALGEAEITVAGIDALLQKYAPTRMPKGAMVDYGSGDFLINVDGANLLGDVFSEASDTRHNYRKVRDGVELLKVVLKEDRASVDELVEFVKGLLPQD